MLRPSTMRSRAWPATIALLVGVFACRSDSNPSSPPPGLFLSVMPPGSNGNSAFGVGFPGQPTVTFPPHFADQLSLYSDLSYAEPHLRASPCVPPADATAHRAASDDACNYFKSAPLEPETVTANETVTALSGAAVTIRRDGWGVPYISGPTRADALFGFGYASGEDRLWLYDLLRNLGRGQLSAFLGPSPAFYSFDSNYAGVSGYDESELTQMLDETKAKFGSLGDQFLKDLDDDVAGLNAYIDSLSGANAARRPPEYSVLKGGGFPPGHFTRNDLLASSVLIQSTFAVGGGSEHLNELLLQELDPAFGAGSTQVSEAACSLWRDLRHADDPDATRTIADSFSESPAKLDETCPQTLPAGAAIWDVGSFQPVTPFGALAAMPMSTPLRRPVTLDPIRAVREALRAAGLAIPDQLSNFVAIDANRTSAGHPIAVMGPQTSYYVPQLLWEVAIHSGGGTPLDFDGRGVVFANLPYIEIGRGTDYAWSATSGDSDLVDIRVSALCNADGSAPSRDDADGDGFPDATGYLFDAQDGKGPQCRRFFERTDRWVAQPTLASLGTGGPAAPQLVTRHILRTHYGPVFATALVAGAPAALSLQRSTFHAKDVGYIHSGLYPRRDPGQSPDLPVWGDGRFEWASGRGLPADFFATYGGTVPYPDRVTPAIQGDPSQGFVEWQDYMAFADHPKAVNPSKGYIASWNNLPAAGWWAADGHGNFGPTHRIDALVRRLDAFQANGGALFDVGNVVEIVADAAFTDLRGQEVLPLLLQIIEGGDMSAAQAQVVTMMQAWIDSGSGSWISGQPGLGAWRRDRDADGLYDQRAQVVLMDAWYPHLIDALLPQVTAIDGSGGQPVADPTKCSGLALQCRLDAPRAQGSAFEYGYYEMMKRVLQMALATPGHTPYRALRCAGTGDAGDCRTAVLTALDQALADLGGVDRAASWDGTTLVSAQNGQSGATVESYDAIGHAQFSLLTIPPIRWTNRPTFQQVVQPE
jgi:acyl-homoserine lactone acylase PvdQ